jgi:O-antigen/teichoic acid export membrane protein
VSQVHSRGKQLVDNTAILTVLQAVSGVLMVALTPLMLGELGLAAYGYWALLNRVLRCSLLTDFGIYPSIVRHVALLVERDEPDAIRALVTIGLVYYVGVAALIMTMCVVLGPWALGGIKLAPALHQQAPALLVLFAGSWLLGLAFWMPLNAALNGIGMVRVSALCGAVGTAVFAIVAAVLLICKLGLGALIIASYAQVVVIIAGAQIAIVRRYGFIYTNPLRIPRSLYGEVLAFGGWVQINTIGALIVDDAPSLFLGHYVGIAAVGLLDVGMKVARAVRMLGVSFNTAFLPMISSLHATGNDRRTIGMIGKADRFVGVLSFASAGFLAVLSPLILRVWLGNIPSAGVAFAVVAVLSTVYLVENVTNVGITGARGVGKPWIGSWSAFAYAVSTLALSLVLTPRLGLTGILIAAGSGAVIANAVFFTLAARAGIGGFRAIVGPWLPSAAGSVALAATATAMLAAAFPHLNRFESAAAVVCFGAVYAIVLVLMLRITKLLDGQDLQSMKAFVPARLRLVLAAIAGRRLFANQ